jgi:anti-repressor protein
MKITRFQPASQTTTDNTFADLLPILQHKEVGSVVDARSLHRSLEVRRDFSNWLKGRLAEIKAVENRDYCVVDGISDFSPNLATTGLGYNNRQINYALTLDIAKQVAMLEHTDIGFNVRQYFIDFEKQYRNSSAMAALPFDISDPESILVYSLQLAKEAKIIKMELEAANTQLAEAAPKVEAYEQIANATGTCSVATAAQELNMGQKELFEKLRNDGILITEGIRRNTPFGQYVQAGYFIVKDTMIEQLNESRPTTRVTPRGRLWLAERYGKPTPQKALTVPRKRRPRSALPGVAA